jgi:hypothetical protein
MFPNVRLVIVAILASVFGISCGFGMFAAFRVNREPFAHVSNGGSLLQLAFAAAAPMADRAAVPFGVRFQVNRPRTSGAAPLDDAAPPAPEAVRQGTFAVQTPPSQSPPASQATPNSANVPPGAASTGASQSTDTPEKPARRHRVVRRRPYQPPAGTAAQPDGQYPTFAQPDAQAAPQTSLRRAAIRHRGLTKKTAGQDAVPQTAIPPRTAVGPAVDPAPR